MRGDDILLKNLWYAVLDAKEVKRNKPIGVTRLSQKLVLWRDEKNQINCIYDQCCHRGASLSIGKLVENYLQCPFHGFQYDASGRVVLIPANGSKTAVPEQYKVNAYLAKEAYGLIWIYNGNPDVDIPEIPFFNELRTGYAYSTFSEVWPVHYTRAVENQLDVVHLPFVHETTIGRGGRKLVNGPVVKWEDNLMTFYVKNEKDHGQIPQKPKEIKDFENLFHLQFQMPNIWQNIISDSVRIVAAFAPIDEDHTRIYLRFYQNF